MQVIRRLRSALLGLAESVTDAERTELVQRYLQHLNRPWSTRFSMPKIG
ncbi:MAG: hypothetical protein ACREXX_15900 [Gammaproteobacteria bacterium]